jgi:hypothetical protein
MYFLFLVCIINVLFGGTKRVKHHSQGVRLNFAFETFNRKAKRRGEETQDTGNLNYVQEKQQKELKTLKTSDRGKTH